ncbi:thioester reductase domain-containing protein [Candidatus Uabimicrobium sp. HlEnr_7]|uniref:non-ribosomal peptide synthetase n=1 Tax=Candidatus Uabimicrobium helgolandensis TaxID=3095367 RepID=UPI003557CD73
MSRNISSLLAEESNFIDILAKHAQKIPEKVAYTFVDGTQEKTITFAQLNASVQILANNLSSYINHGDRVLLALSPSLDFPKALFSCFHLGAIAVPFYIPVNNQFSTELLAKIVKDAGIKTVLTNSELQPQIKNSLEEINCLDINEFYAQSSSLQTVKHHDIALLLYTSGSTGDPKGVMLTHHNIMHNMLWLQHHNNLEESDVVLTWLPNSPVAGLYTRLLGIVLGGHTVIFPTLHFLQQPLLWLELISKYNATFSAAPNFAYDLCSQTVQTKSLEHLNLDSWKMAISGGEIIRIRTLNRFIDTFGKYGFTVENFFPYYGSTEGLCITLPRPNHKLKTISINREQLIEQKVDFVDKNDERSLIFVSNGSIFEDATIKIVDPQTQKICAENSIGEVWACSASNTQGYWQKEEYSTEICHAYLGEEGPFYRTGDLGFLKNNELYITGRLKELIILNGKNYYPEDIEISALENTPESIVSAAAFSVDIEDKESLIVLLGYEKQVTDIQKIMDNLHKVYSQKHGIRVYGFIVVDDNDIPRASTRKIKRSVCRSYYLSNRFKLCATKSIHIQKFSGLISLPSSSESSDKLVQNLVEYLGSSLNIDLDNINTKQPIYNLGIDSITMVKILTELNDHFNVQIPNSIFFSETSVNQLAVLILDLFYKRSVCNDSLITFDEELQQVQSLCGNLPDISLKQKNVFVTGVTGFLGSYLLYDLLTKSSYEKIYCLVRAHDKNSAFERIKGSVYEWREEFADKLVIVTGTVDEEYMGLSEGVFLELAKEIDCVIHNAANVNFVAPYEYLKKTNVHSCLEIIRLATKFRLKPVHFVSTLAVFNSPQRPERVTENSYIDDVNTLYSGYAQSKWVAEKLFQEAQNQLLPVSIYRPGLITGDMNTGYCNSDDFLCRFIKGGIQKQRFPDIDIEIDMTPVNYVSEAIVHLLDKPNQVYHLANPQPIKLKSYVSWLQEYGFSVELIDFESWLKLLKDNMEDNALFPVLPFITEKHPTNKKTILEFFAKRELNYDCQNTVSNVSHCVSCSPVDDNLLRMNTSYLQKVKFLPEI